MDYGVRLAKDYSRKTLENYEKCKNIVDNEVTFLLNCLLGILTVTVPSNPNTDICYLSKRIYFDDFKEFNIKNTVIKNRNKDNRLVFYLYSIRNSSTHRYEENFKRILDDDVIKEIIFISGAMTIKLTIDQIEKLMKWVVENVI